MKINQQNKRDIFCGQEKLNHMQTSIVTHTSKRKQGNIRDWRGINTIGEKAGIGDKANTIDTTNQSSQTTKIILTIIKKTTTWRDILIQ